MQIAVLADTHLADQNQRRFAVLEFVLSDIKQRGVNLVVINGDFCEQAPFPYEKIRQILSRFGDIKFYIIIGNHDLKYGRLSDKYIALDNVIVVDKACLLPEDPKVLLLPYQEQVSMGERLFEAVKTFSLKEKGWVLLSHGDLIYGNLYYQDEGYFPITVADLRLFSPALTVLGHIHAPVDYPELNLYYCGSLSPLNSSEIGVRRYAILDLDNFSIEWIAVNFGELFWKTELFIYNSEKIYNLLEALYRNLEDVFSQRSYWIRDLTLDLTVFSVDSNDGLLSIIKQWFSQKGLSKVEISFVPLDLPTQYSSLIESFVEKVDEVCQQESDFFPWSRYKDKIICEGLNLFRERISRLR